MCGAPATSREHVPPLCLFPEEKDIKDSTFRSNLITVPSCVDHNSKKSNDDEFLMATISGVVGNNVIGFIHLQTKVKRALERKTSNFMDAIMKERQSHTLITKSGKKYPVFVGNPDLPRLHSCFKHIAHGIFYHNFGKHFEGTTHTLIDFVTYEERWEKYKLLCRKRFEMEPNKPKTEGATPEIFNYEIFEPDEAGFIGMRMTFYGGAVVFVAFEPTGAGKHQDMISQMLDAGISTTVFFKDGSEFRLDPKQDA